MRASECIRHDTPRFHVYGTEQGERNWRKTRSELKARAAAQRASLATQRVRDFDDRFDDQREYELTLRSLEHAEHVLRHFQVIEPAASADVVDIGVIVTYCQYGESGAPLDPVTVHVGEYGVDDINASPRVMSYDNRVLLQLMGSRIGTVKTVPLTNGRESEFEILDIRLPHAHPPLKRVA